jgi:hypothetical protein
MAATAAATEFVLGDTRYQLLAFHHEDANPIDVHHLERDVHDLLEELVHIFLAGQRL